MQCRASPFDPCKTLLPHQVHIKYALGKRNGQSWPKHTKFPTPNDKGLTYLQQSDGLKDCCADEKWEECRRKSCTSLSLSESVCVVLTGYLIQAEKTERARDRRQRGRQWRGEGRQLWRKVKWCGHSPSPGKPTPLSKKKTQPMTNTGNCVGRESHDCQSTTPSLCTETRTRKEHGRKRGKTETQGTYNTEVYKKKKKKQLKL